MKGTLVNAGTVLLGGSTGLLVGQRLPDRVRETVFAGIGLFTLVLGTRMALRTENVLILLGSTLLGALIGELVGIQKSLDSVGSRLQRHFPTASGRFGEASVTSSLVFCVGPMTVVGAIQDGLSGNIELLVTKSMLDGFASFAFAASLGVGVMFSIVTILIFQGSLTVGLRARRLGSRGRRWLRWRLQVG